MKVTLLWGMTPWRYKCTEVSSLSLFWVATQRVFAYYRRFRTTHRFNFQRSVIPLGMDIFNCWGWNQNTLTKRQTYCRCL